MAFSKDVFWRNGVTCQNLMKHSPGLINPRSQKKRWKGSLGEKEEREGEGSIAREMSFM